MADASSSTGSRRAADLLRCVQRSPWLAAAILLGALALAWPVQPAARYFGDSAEYVAGSVRRLPGVFLLTQAFGLGYGLNVAQTVLSVLAWGLLGWSLAANAGMLLALALSLARPVSQWNLMVLSESLTFSSLAALVGLTVLLLRRWSAWRFAAWVACAVIHVFTREPNVVVLPFLVLPFLARPRRLVWVALAVLLVGGAKQLYALRVMAYQHGHVAKLVGYQVYRWPEARDWFVARGMPDIDPYTETDEDLRFAYERWMVEHGSTALARWLVGRSTSYADAWAALFDRLNEVRKTLGLYGKGLVERRVAQAVYGLYYAAGRVPAWLWLFGLLLPLAARLRGRPMDLALLAAALVPATLAVAFVCFHGDTDYEIERHMLPAAVLFRITLLVEIAALVEVVRGRGPAGRGVSPGTVS